ncbi:MAG: hypothetical protein EP335_17310 [Alphaproteobacteria bacterium]|nr:MAG: hypothetical protein EP335_17310 [Alphaproteobacteria bacterium]
MALRLSSGAVQKTRSAFAVQKSVIFALSVREMYRQFGEYKMGTIWVLLEPLLMMVLFMGMFGARGRGEFGFIEPPLFVFAAFLPFRGLFQAGLRETMTAKNIHSGLSHLRQVGLFDVMLARACMNVVIESIVALIIGFGLAWLGYDPIPDHILETLLGLLMILLFGFGLGLVFTMLASYARELDKLFKMLNMPLLFLSAVFFPMSVVPEPYRTWLSYNPLVHAMEFIREMWFAHYTSPVLDMEYYVAWMIAVWSLGLALYHQRWREYVKAS